MALTTATTAYNFTETTFFILNRLAAAGANWSKITKTAPYIMKTLETDGLIEIDAERTHARITNTGKKAHADARILRGSGEALPTSVEEIRKWRYLR